MKISGVDGSTSEAYDREYLLASVDGNAEIAREIVALYLNESPEMLSRLGKMIEAGDLAAVESAAHRLKGAMLAMGARAGALAGDLEELAHAGELTACREKFALLAAEAAVLADELIKLELGGVLPEKS